MIDFLGEEGGVYLQKLTDLIIYTFSAEPVSLFIAPAAEEDDDLSDLDYGSRSSVAFSRDSVSFSRDSALFASGIPVYDEDPDAYLYQ